MSFVMVFICFSCQHSILQSQRDIAGHKSEKAEKKYFLNVTTEQRAENLAKAQIFLPESDISKINQVDIVKDYLKKNCNSDFNYKDDKGIHWPTETCTYVPDTENKLGGGSPKFLCEFSDISKKDGKVVKTVKYTDNNFVMYSGEVPDVIFSTNIAKLLGFPVIYYCPVHVICKNCPSANPWRNQRASALPVTDSNIEFDYAMTKEKSEFNLISEPSSRSAQGVSWDEIRNVQAETETEKRKMKIDREVWMLWVHFIQMTDAHGGNQHLACQEAVETSEAVYQCKKTFLFTNDYGFSMGNGFNLIQWEEQPTLRPLSHKSCAGVLSKKNFGVPARPAMSGLVLDSNISEEAKNIFLDRILKITDDQWQTVFQLSKAEKFGRRAFYQFQDILKTKLTALQNMKCDSFDSQKTVLGNNK